MPLDMLFLLLSSTLFQLKCRELIALLNDFVFAFVYCWFTRNSLSFLLMPLVRLCSLIVVFSGHFILKRFQNADKATS